MLKQSHDEFNIANKGNNLYIRRKEMPKIIVAAIQNNTDFWRDFSPHE